MKNDRKSSQTNYIQLSINQIETNEEGKYNSNEQMSNGTDYGLLESEQDGMS